MNTVKTLALAFLAVSILHGGESRFGLQATVSKPSGDAGNRDWLDNKPGFGAGIHGQIDLGGGAVLVPRMDYVMYKNDRTIASQFNEDQKINILSGGADFRFHLGGEAGQGFYLLGGLGYARGKFDQTYSSTSLSVNVDGTRGALYLQGGLGIHFTPNIGLECRYQSLKFTDVETTFLGYHARQDVSCPSIQASVVFCF